VEGAAAKLVFADWRTGSKLHIEPPAHIEWPVVEKVDGKIVAHVATGVEPAQLEVRFFSALASGTLVPTDDGQLLQCAVGATSSGCTYQIAETGVDVTVVVPKAVVAMVITGRWYVPVKDRTAADPAVSLASWGVQLPHG
jgi:hypothetical protein